MLMTSLLSSSPCTVVILLDLANLSDVIMMSSLKIVTTQQHIESRWYTAFAVDLPNKDRHHKNIVFAQVPTGENSTHFLLPV